MTDPIWITLALSLVLAGSLVAIGIGCASWRSGGKLLVPVGAMNGAMGVAILLRNNGSAWQYVAWAVFLILLVTNLSRVSHATWRAFRLELVLFATLVASMTTMTWFGADMSTEMRGAAVVVIAVVTAWLLGSGSLKAGRKLYLATQIPPRTE